MHVFVSCFWRSALSPSNAWRLWVVFLMEDCCLDLQAKSPLLMLEVSVSGLGSRCQCDSQGRASTCLFCEELQRKRRRCSLKRQTLVLFTHLNESEMHCFSSKNTENNIKLAHTTGSMTSNLPCLVVHIVWGLDRKWSYYFTENLPSNSS